MTPAIRLTERERADVHKVLFDEKRKDYLFMQEVLSEYKGWHEDYVLDDAIAMKKAMDAALWLYLDKTGMFDEAEQEILSSKSINGKRYLEA